VNPPKFTFQHSAQSLCLRLSSVSSPVLRRLGGGGAEEDASVVASLRFPFASLRVHSRLPKNVDLAFPPFSLRPPVQSFSSHWPVRTSHLVSPKTPAVPAFPSNPTWLSLQKNNSGFSSSGLCARSLSRPILTVERDVFVVNFPFRRPNVDFPNFGILNSEFSTLHSKSPVLPHVVGYRKIFPRLARLFSCSPVKKLIAIWNEKCDNNEQKTSFTNLTIYAQV
jgi:hypothetical protein